MKRQLILTTLLFLSIQFCFSQDYRFGKVSKEELSQTEHPTDPEAVAAVLYREMKTNFKYTQDNGFFIITDVFERIKIYKKEGFDWGTKEIEMYRASNRNEEEVSGLKAYTYVLGANGKVEEIKLKGDGIFDEKRSKVINLKKFTMPGLKEGCIIEYKYSFKSPFISSIDTYRFQESIPVGKVSLRFEAPEYFNYKTHRRGWVPYEIKKDKYERTLNYRYRRSNLETGSVVGNTVDKQVKFFQHVSEVDMENIPAIKEEAYSGNLDNYTASLKFELAYTQFPNSQLEFYSTDWEAVCKKIYNYDSFGGQLAKKGYFEKDLDPILASAPDTQSKIVAVYEFVKSKMKWNKYLGYTSDEGVKRAYKDGTGNVGDINLVLVAALRHAGLDANPVLVSTKSNGIPIFPTRNGFNYVIAGVELQGQVVLLNATNKLGEPNILQDELLNWQGRIIRENGTSGWVELVPAKQAVKAFMVNGTIAEDGTVEGSIKSQYSGNSALSRRYRYAGLDESGITTKVQDAYDDVETFEVSCENLTDVYKPLKMDYGFETSTYVEEIEGDLYLSPMLFLSMAENPFKLEERKYPIDYGYSKKERFIINLDIPENYSVKSLPEGAHVTMGDMMAFKYLLSEAGGKIRLMVDFQINTAFVGAENYEEVKSFYQFIINKEKEKIVLTKS